LKKILLWIVFPLLVLGFAAFQWVGAAQENKRLAAGIAKLENDLQMIVNARSKLPEITQRIAAENAVIKELHKRLPREPMVEHFMENLSEQAKGAGVEIVKYTFTTVKNDFYDKTQLEITLQDEPREPAVLQEMVSKSERLVVLKEFIPGPPVLLRLNIYSSSSTLKTPSVEPCPESNGSTVGLWPFNSFVEARRHTLEQLCVELNKEEAILLELKRYKNIMVYKLQLEDIMDGVFRKIVIEAENR
jgi:Tfp pilus assembly protein PilO